MLTCNITYTEQGTGKQRECQGDATGPRPARWSGMGVRSCEACWPGLKSKLLEQYGKSHPGLAMQAINRLFRRV